MLRCSISGNSCSVPVVSPDGYVFEKETIRNYISKNHENPLTGNKLEEDDLIELKVPQIPATALPELSVPGLLAALSKQFEAQAEELLKVRKELAETRQELASETLRCEAATRIVSKLISERDEARDALSALKGLLSDAERGESTNPEAPAGGEAGEEGEAMATG